jgi:TRAP-type C4-dicarboxylate transport system substrate-binding protein
VSKQGAVAFAAALVVAATACSGSGGDKAGGRQAAGKPLVLRLAVHDPGWGAGEFAEAVEERSDGSIEIRPERGPRMDAIDWERRTVEDVRAGRIELGLVGARVWDTLGVRSFRALVAPLLVDDLELERRVLESPLSSRMLVRVKRAEVIGVALLPGPLRHPFGHSARLIRRADYEGQTIGVSSGRVEQATFQTLGASTRKYLSLHPSFFGGAALDPSTIVDSGYTGETLAANVVLWPRPETIVMNLRAFRALSFAQQRILLEAGRSAARPRTDRIERSEEEAVRAICTGDLASLVTVSPGDVEALRDAVRPVYAQLERDPETKHLIVEIRKLRAQPQSDPLRCPVPETGFASELEGRWQAATSGGELVATGVQSREIPSGLSGLEIEFEDGRWIARGLNTERVWTGTYTVSGVVVRLTVETCSHNPCTPGASGEHAWSVYRNTLSLTRLPGRSSWPLLTAKPFTRVR